MDELDVLVKAPAEVCANQDGLVQFERRFNYEVQSALGITHNVKLVGPGEIQRSEGQAELVADKRTL